MVCLGLMTRRGFCDDNIYTPQKNLLSEVNTGSPTFVQYKDINGNTQTVYHVNIIYLLDRVFINDNIGFLSIEQTQFIEDFFKEAHEVTELLNTQPEYDAYVGMTKQNYSLDKFLGNFIGVNDGQFTR